MQVNIQITGLDKIQKQLRGLSNSQIKDAAAKALNDTAFKVRKAMQDDFTKSFDRLTPYIKNSVRVKQATPDKLVATIAPDIVVDKGVDPQSVLRAQAMGGPRRDKRSEKLLRAAGILPAGYQTVIPGDKYGGPFPGSDDGRGNLKGSFMQQLLSYFQSFSEVGSKANMKQKRKDKLHGYGVSANGYKTINGVVYFVAYGKLRSGPSSHLAPGIWAKKGTHGANLKPVLMFVRSPNFTARLSDERIVKAVDVHTQFSSRFRLRVRNAFESLGK